MVFWTRGVAVLGLPWLVCEMKRGNDAFYDAEIIMRNWEVKLASALRTALSGLQHTMRNSFILSFCTSTVIYLGTSHPCRCNRETAYGNVKHLHEAGSSFGRSR
jgi:hypothetical protein